MKGNFKFQNLVTLIVFQISTFELRFRVSWFEDEAFAYLPAYLHWLWPCS